MCMICNNHIISFLVLPQLTLSVSQNLRLLTLVITEGLDPTCFARKTFLSDSSTSSLLHSDLIVSVNSDDSAINLFCWFSSCAHNKFIKMMRSFQICFLFFCQRSRTSYLSIKSSQMLHIVRWKLECCLCITFNQFHFYGSWWNCLYFSPQCLNWLF